MWKWEAEILECINGSTKWSTLTPEEIKEIRRSYNLSQRSFAEMLDISVKTLQNYEIGHRKPNSTACALFKCAKDHPSIFSKKVGNDCREFQR